VQHPSAKRTGDEKEKKDCRESWGGIEHCGATPNRGAGRERGVAIYRRFLPSGSLGWAHATFIKVGEPSSIRIQAPSKGGRGGCRNPAGFSNQWPAPNCNSPFPRPGGQLLLSPRVSSPDPFPGLIRVSLSSSPHLGRIRWCLHYDSSARPQGQTELGAAQVGTENAMYQVNVN
jgi:hypothetical protein